MKKCKHCNVELIPDLNITAKRIKKRDYLCRDCSTIYSRRNSVKYLYGITIEEYDALLEKHHICAICEEPWTDTPRVDHDHGTGKVRGLLCNQCNIALGAIKENRDNIIKMIVYLDESRYKPM